MSFAQGMNQGLQVVSNFAKLRDYKQDKDREEKLRAQMEEANKAGQEAFKSFMTPAEQAQPKTVMDVSVPASNGLSDAVNPMDAMNSTAPGLGQQNRVNVPGGLSLGGASLSTGGQRTEQAAKPPAVDEREGILVGMQARRKHLMKSGVDPKMWTEDWKAESTLRGEIRNERLDSAEKRFMATGDPGEYAKLVYPLIDDGHDFVGANRVKAEDGTDAFEFVRRDSAGNEVKNTMTMPQFQKFMMGVRDPAKVREVEAKSLLEQIKADEAIRTKEGEQQSVRKTNDAKSKLTLGEIGARTGGSLAVTREAGAQARQTKTTTPAASPKNPSGASANPSAANRILNEREVAAAAIKANPTAAAAIKARFKDRTGKDF